MPKDVNSKKRVKPDPDDDEEEEEEEEEKPDLSSSEEFEEGDDDDSEEDGKPLKKKQKTKSAPESSKSKAKTEPELKNDDGEPYALLSKNRRITVREFKGVPLVDIREYYEDKSSGAQKPGSKGISLSLEQFEALKDILPTVDSWVSKLNSKKGEGSGGKKGKK